MTVGFKVFLPEVFTLTSSDYEEQMADPELRKRRPYGVYRHGDAHPRPQHLAWNGIALPLDDPWWESHTLSNASAAA